MERKPRRKDDKIVTNWIFFRYMIIGIYVGVSTVGIFMYYYMYYNWSNESHSMISSN